MRHIFITGGIGSGKTYLADRLRGMTGLSVISLDEVFFDLASETHREKRTAEERDRLLAEEIRNACRIFEGWHFGEWLHPLYGSLSLAVIVDTPLKLRRARIQERFERRKAGIEPDPFPMGGKEHLENLLKWTALFDAAASEKAIRACGPWDLVVMITDGWDCQINEIAQQCRAAMRVNARG